MTSDISFSLTIVLKKKKKKKKKKNLARPRQQRSVHSLEVVALSPSKLPHNFNSKGPATLSFIPIHGGDFLMLRSLWRAFSGKKTTNHLVST